MKASPKKLKDGSWGALVQSASVTDGDVVTVTTRAGKSWDAVISRVLWSGDGMAICATESLDRPSSSRRHGRSCSCQDECCARGCRCDDHCVCRGGNIYDC